MGTPAGRGPQDYRPKEGPPAAPPVPGGPLVGVPPMFTFGVVPGIGILLGFASFPRVMGLGPRSRAPGPTPPTDVGGATPVFAAPPVTVCARAVPQSAKPSAPASAIVRIMMLFLTARVPAVNEWVSERFSTLTKGRCSRLSLSEALNLGPAASQCIFTQWRRDAEDWSGSANASLARWLRRTVRSHRPRASVLDLGSFGMQGRYPI